MILGTAPNRAIDGSPPIVKPTVHKGTVLFVHQAIFKLLFKELMGVLILCENKDS